MRWQWIGSWAAGRLWCAGESWPSCTEEGRRSAATRFKLGAAASKSTLRFVEDASRPGGSATASRSPAAGGSAASAQGLLGDSGGCDAAGAAAAELAARHSRAAPWTGSSGSGEMSTEASRLRLLTKPNRATCRLAAGARQEGEIRGSVSLLVRRPTTIRRMATRVPSPFSRAQSCQIEARVAQTESFRLRRHFALGGYRTALPFSDNELWGSETT